MERGINSVNQTGVIISAGYNLRYSTGFSHARDQSGKRGGGKNQHHETTKTDYFYKKRRMGDEQLDNGSSRTIPDEERKGIRQKNVAKKWLYLSSEDILGSSFL